MYKMQEVTPEFVKAFKVPDDLQQYVIEEDGEPLNPIAAYELLKKETENFTLKLPQAEEADHLLFELLHGKSVDIPKKDTSQSLSIEALKLKEKERIRALALLELELEMELEENPKKQTA